MIVEKVTLDAAGGVARAVTDAGKRAWSVLDAASEKPTPDQYLSPKTVRSIQGRDADAQRLGGRDDR
jgi:hypothetical protein